MNIRYALSLVLNAHLPYVREFTKNSLAANSAEESWFFDALSETYLPLLALFDRLEGENIPFRLGIAVSPALGQMLGDNLLLSKYTANLDHQIEFGEKEIERLRDSPDMLVLAKQYLDQAVDRRVSFTGRYDGNILQALDHYREKGNIEILASPATHAFLPFFCAIPEPVQAQIEAAQQFYRYSFGLPPKGFWLPELGWSKNLDPVLRSYGFKYTIADSHGFIFGNPPPSRGSFFPVRTPENLAVFARDFYACAEIGEMRNEKTYRNNNQDIAYELPPAAIGRFIARNGARCCTGYKYCRGDGKTYNAGEARLCAEKHAEIFFENCVNRLAAASKYMDEIPISLAAFNADSFGRHWHEGIIFLETLFRLASKKEELQFMTPAEYLGRYEVLSFDVSVPEFSSWGINGYAETWLDSSNDWMYRDLIHSIECMVEMANRYVDVSGYKERTLNQAARELLLAQCSDWPSMLQRHEGSEYARNQVKEALRNFKVIYEALNSSNISAEWLTRLERRHNIFPYINYRIFRSKQ